MQFREGQAVRVAWAPDEFHLGHIVEIRPEVDRGAQIVQLLRIKYDSDGLTVARPKDQRQLGLRA